MAKKVSLHTNDHVGDIIPDEGRISHKGVNYTAGSARNPNIASKFISEHDAVYPLVDVHCLEAQDANDGSENGKQDSFSMPSFANGRDLRHRG